jgi:hypothetical protein
MADQVSNPPPATTASPAAEPKAITPAPLSADSPTPTPAPAAVKQLSKEEQMAAFEEDLKYNDWGHQPC